MRLLLDTNILIDAFMPREPFYQDWLKILELWANGRVELWASAKSFTDIHYACSRHHDSITIQRAFVKAAEYLNLCSIDGQDVLRSARLEWRDFEDCLIYQAARKIRADFIITRNPADFERPRIPVLTPRAFFDYLHDELHLIFEDDEESTNNDDGLA